jgi:hypothetical protein
MRLDHLRIHQSLSRRDALRLGAGAVAAGLATNPSRRAAGGRSASTPPTSPPASPAEGEHDDEMFDVEAVIGGAWVPSAYGDGDQRGSFNEVTPERTAAALALLQPSEPVNTYQLGEAMFNGFPAFPADPPRVYEMHLYVLGYEPPEGFVDGGGVLAGPDPIGPNLVTVNEERFAENFTFQIGSQIDGLGHVGVADMFYNGFRGADLATATGLAALGNETMGPVVTRAVIYDVVGLKVAQGASDDFFEATNGQPVLRDDYRITLDDLRGCLERQGVRDDVGPGDVPILHTGWTHLAGDDPERYLTQEPGIFLAEARAFAARKPALIASDTWGVEVLSPDVTGGNAFPCHQELFGKFGIRLGESFVTDAAIADNVFEGVLVVTPENAPGATCGSSAPALLGQPGQPPTD